MSWVLPSELICAVLKNFEQERLLRLYQDPFWKDFLDANGAYIADVCGMYHTNYEEVDLLKYLKYDQPVKLIYATNPKINYYKSILSYALSQDKKTILSVDLRDVKVVEKIISDLGIENVAYDKTCLYSRLPMSSTVDIRVNRTLNYLETHKDFTSIEEFPEMPFKLLLSISRWDMLDTVDCLRKYGGISFNLFNPLFKGVEMYISFSKNLYSGLIHDYNSPYDIEKIYLRNPPEYRYTGDRTERPLSLKRSGNVFNFRVKNGVISTARYSTVWDFRSWVLMNSIDTSDIGVQICYYLLKANIRSGKFHGGSPNFDPIETNLVLITNEELAEEISEISIEDGKRVLSIEGVSRNCKNRNWYKNFKRFKKRTLSGMHRIEYEMSIKSSVVQTFTEELCKSNGLLRDLEIDAIVFEKSIKSRNRDISSTFWMLTKIVECALRNNARVWFIRDNDTEEPFIYLMYQIAIRYLETGVLPPFIESYRKIPEYTNPNRIVKKFIEKTRFTTGHLWIEDIYNESSQFNTLLEALASAT